MTRHFNCFISNTYKKTGGRGPTFSTKVWQIVTSPSPLTGPHTNARNPNPLYGLLHNSRYTRGGVPGADASSRYDLTCSVASFFSFAGNPRGPISGRRCAE
jgi:hypothetical protein